MLALHRYRGLAFIALWQAAPVVVHQDSAGRVQIHFAAGGGRYEEVTTSCDGDVLGTEDFGYSGGGIAVEAWPTDWARLNAFGGLTDSESPDFSSLNLGGMAALEWRLVGIGAGVAVLPAWRGVPVEPDGPLDVSDLTEYLPVVYARLGDIDGLHLRLESTSDRGLDRMSGFARLGLGYNQGLVRGTRVFGGLAACHAGCEGDEGETGVAFLDIAVPVARAFDLQAGVVYGTGEANPEYGFTLGGTWHFRPTVALQSTEPAP